MSSKLDNEEIIRRHGELESGRLPTVEGRDVIEEIHLERYRFAGKYTRESKVLDIACGIGYGSFRLATESNPKEIHGVDVSENAITEAKKKYQSPKLNFRMVDGTHLPFPDEYFDTVVSFETIEHTVDPDQFLRELLRVLKPDGVVIISTPNKRYHSFGKRKPWNPFHTKEYFPEEFKLLLEKHMQKLEFWGGQEFLESKFSTLLRYNWIEIKYYKLLHHPLMSKIIKPIVGLKRLLVGKVKAPTERSSSLAAIQERSSVETWMNGREPYTMVAVGRK